MLFRLASELVASHSGCNKQLSDTCRMVCYCVKIKKKKNVPAEGWEMQFNHHIIRFAVSQKVPLQGVTLFDTIIES